MEYEIKAYSNRIEARDDELIGVSYCVHTYNDIAVLTGEKIMYYDQEPEIKYSWDSRADIPEFAEIIDSESSLDVSSMDLVDEMKGETQEDVPLDSVSDEITDAEYNVGVLSSDDPRFIVTVDEGISRNNQMKTDSLTAMMVTVQEPRADIPAAFYYEGDDISREEFDRRIGDVSGMIGNHRFHAGNIPK